MQPFYILCFVAAFSLFLWQSVSDARQSVVQQTMLLVTTISNGGYAALAGAENLREAVLATKILYTGACFLPMLYFITMCEVCCVHLNRFLLAGMTLVQTLLFGFVCTIGHNNLFHKAIVFHQVQGISYRTKEYGPFHLMYPLTMYLYYLLTLVLAIIPVDELTALGQKMRQARKNAGLTQQELSDQSHVSVKQIANIEKGKMKPSYLILRALAKVLHISFAAVRS